MYRSFNVLQPLPKAIMASSGRLATTRAFHPQAVIASSPDWRCGFGRLAAEATRSEAWQPYPMREARQTKWGGRVPPRREAMGTCAGHAAERGTSNADQPLRCRILARIRRFFWPSFRRPLPVFLTPMLVST
jgi:hypothetical protein